MIPILALKIIEISRSVFLHSSKAFFLLYATLPYITVHCIHTSIFRVDYFFHRQGWCLERN